MKMVTAKKGLRHVRKDLLLATEIEETEVVTAEVVVEIAEVVAEIVAAAAAVETVVAVVAAELLGIPLMKFHKARMLESVDATANQ